MFTGLIEEIATVEEIKFSGKDARITIACPKSAGQIRKGDSISVDGVCLTAVEQLPNGFSSDISSETLERTTFSRLKSGIRVNVELALPVNGRFGGHFVQGHVDGIGKLLNKSRTGNGWSFDITFPLPLTPFIANKGSIAVNGISLTVAGLQKDYFTVAVVPHTYENTTMQFMISGDSVNLEADILAKYVARLFDYKKESAIITEEYLKEHGFLG